MNCFRLEHCDNSINLMNLIRAKNMCKTVSLGSISTAHSSPVSVPLREERGGTWKGERRSVATGNPQFHLSFRYLAYLGHTCYLARKEFVQLLLSKHVISNQFDSPVRFS